MTGPRDPRELPPQLDELKHPAEAPAPAADTWVAADTQSDEQHDSEWARVKADLLRVQQAEREEWGDVDELLLARYLAGTCSESERLRVEEAMSQHSRVRDCVAVLERVYPDEQPAPAPPRISWWTQPRLAWGLAAACLLLALGVYGFEQRRQQTLALAYAQAPARQFYGEWQSGTLAGEKSDYRTYYFKPDPQDKEYQYHLAIRPKGSDYLYYYNPKSETFWGRFVLKGENAGKYSELPPKDRLPYLYRNGVPAVEFPEPGPMPEIPGASDHTPMHPPTDYPAEPPVEKLPKLNKES
jgi:hypothetical protein